MKIRYIEHHPDEWLVGVAGLTPEQNGIYRTVCDLIASTGGPIPVDDERLFRIIKAKRNRIKRVITELLAGHKLAITDSQLSNKRVISELERANNRSKSGSERAERRWNFNNLGDAGSNARALKNQEPRTINQEPLEKPPQRRGSRLPPDFTVPQEWKEQGSQARLKAKLPQINLDAEADQFADYWHAKAGKDGTKLDWRLTWLTWCRNAKSANASNIPAGQSNGHSMFDTGPTEPPPTFEGFELPTGRPH